MARKWTIRMFGELRAERGDRVVSRFRGRKAGALLARLAFPPLRAHPRERLIDLLWGDEALDLASPRQSLSQEIYSLRNQLAEPDLPPRHVILSSRDEAWLSPEIFTSDVEAFETAIADADRAGTEFERGRRLADAVVWYRGELLPGLYDEWVLAERYRLAELHVRSRRDLLTLAEAAGDAGAAFDHATAITAADPLEESAHRALMQLHAAAGRWSSAERQFEALVEILDAELGVGPEPASLALLESIRREAKRGRHQAFGPGASRTAQNEGPPTGGDGTRGGVDGPRSGHGQHAEPAFEANSVATEATGAGASTITALVAEIPVINTSAATAAATVDDVVADVGSTAGAEVGADVSAILTAHGGVLRAASEGWVAATFGRASDALAAAGDAVAAMGSASEKDAGTGPRLGIATGEVAAGADGRDVHEAAIRLALAAQVGRVIVSASTAALAGSHAAGARLVDRGRWILAGSTAPARVFELASEAGDGVDAGPPVRGERVAAGRLPWRSSRFFGREAERREITTRLADGTVRMLTLLGPAGVGKTRLALEVAEGRIEALDGAVNFAPLADLEDGAHVADALASALGANVSSGVDVLDAVIEALSIRPSLLVLDNAEHLIDALSPIVSTILERAPGATLFITSQRRLGLRAEQVFPLDPLPVPADGMALDAMADTLSDDELSALRDVTSVALFIDRAREAFPEFRLMKRNAHAVAEICRRLDGVPLALELAASRIAVLTPARLLEHLDDRFGLLVSRHRDGDPRHRALDTAIEWTVQLLDEADQGIFAELSVFRGGFSLEAVEAVCSGRQGAAGAENGTHRVVPSIGAAGTLDALEVVSRLIDASLITIDDGAVERRFRMLESLRAYGAGLLGPEVTAALQERHAAWMLDLAERAEPNLTGPEQAAWMDRLDVERENLRAALDWCLEAGEVETGIQLGGAVWRYWYLRGATSEGLGWLIALLDEHELNPIALETRHLARAMHGLGTLAYMQTQDDLSRRWLTRCLQTQRTLGDLKGEAAALNNLGMVAQRASDVSEASRCYRLSLDIKVRIGDARGALSSRINLATVALILDDLKTARSEAARAVDDSRAFGDLWSCSRALVLLGHVELVSGDAAAATHLLQESLGLQEAIGDRASVPGTLVGLAAARLQQDLPTDASALLDRAEKLVRDTADVTSRADILASRGDVALYSDDPATAISAFAECVAIQSRLGREHHRVSAELGLAWAYVMIGDAESARGIVRRSMTMADQPVRITAMAVDVCAMLASEAGDNDTAYELAAYADAMRESKGLIVPVPARRHRSRLLARASAGAGDRADRARPLDAGATRDEALAAALASLEKSGRQN